MHPQNAWAEVPACMMQRPCNTGVHKVTGQAKEPSGHLLKRKEMEMRAYG